MRRGLQIFSLAALLGLVVLIFTARPSTQGQFWASLTRQQMTLVVGRPDDRALLPAAWRSPRCLSWSVGESLCRERWGAKLAAFDALFQRQLEESDRGGLPRCVAMPPALHRRRIVASLVPLGRFGGRLGVDPFQFGPFWNHARWPSLSLILSWSIFSLYTTLVRPALPVSLAGTRSSASDRRRDDRALATSFALLLADRSFCRSRWTISDLDPEQPGDGGRSSSRFDLLTPMLARSPRRRCCRSSRFVFADRSAVAAARVDRSARGRRPARC